MLNYDVQWFVAELKYFSNSLVDMHLQKTQEETSLPRRTIACCLAQLLDVVLVQKY